jgi:hypothetical protein
LRFEFLVLKMPMSREQLASIHILAHKAGIDTKHDRASYELLLTNVAGVVTSKDLNQRSFEDVMATLEDLAEGNGVDVGPHWRHIVATRGSSATSRMVWLIRQLHTDYEALRGEGDPHYELAGLVERMSRGRRLGPISDLALLTPREAWNMIEAMKGIIARLAPQPETQNAKLETQNTAVPF